MATRATIGIKTDKGLRSIYQHWDGYPTGLARGLGETLRDHYNTPEAINALLDMGSASKVEKTLAESEFYHRDKGESLENTQAVEVKNVKALCTEFPWCQWHYVFTEGKGWKCYGIKMVKGRKEYEWHTIPMPGTSLDKAIAKEEARIAKFFAKAKK